MTFFEDPRLRQSWNRISYNAGEVTETAAAGIWSFQHHYVNPCLVSLAACLEQCTTPCLGDREERARRRRERERARGRAEYVFDFYDDWYAEDEFEGGAGGSTGGGILGGWGEEHWDRLLAGTGSQRRHHGDHGALQEQPKRRRGMSMGYGTRGGRRLGSADQDPTIIPSTQPIGFLGRLPWKLGKTLRYRPSAADLQDHPRQHGDPGYQASAGEDEPLLLDGHREDSDDEGAGGFGGTGAANRTTGGGRNRSGTTGSGDTSDSYRSRGDLFPSDGEGDEDAVPLDDEFAMVLAKVGGTGTGDDRSSGKSGRTRSSKGKRRARTGSTSRPVSRTVSGATINSTHSEASTVGLGHSSTGSIPASPEAVRIPSMEDLQVEEGKLRKEEEEEVIRKRRAAAALAIERGLRARAGPGSAQQPRTPATETTSGDTEARTGEEGEPKGVEEEKAPQQPPWVDVDRSGLQSNKDQGPHGVEDTAETLRAAAEAVTETVTTATTTAATELMAAPADDAEGSRSSESFVPARLPQFR
ncbi:hypothetical protein ACRALDRAFT_2050738 [Sodiomyces alcalophilus JCM 7366]|uniref:uncharacterized protein n=1 Tax=Sodiomyces alcalophilus JCM 7366 TaxID=591952 RepID=UPI0039B4159F